MSLNTQTVTILRGRKSTRGVNLRVDGFGLACV
jgi:hypothetical protein